MILAIYGTGGTGRTVVDLVGKEKSTWENYEEIIFVDDITKEEKMDNWRVLSFSRIISLYRKEEIDFLVCVGDPAIRKKLAEKILSHGYRLGKWIHPDAEISSSALIGEGTVVLRCFIDSRVKIGDNVFISWDAVIGHDTIINDHCLLSPHTFIGGGCNMETEIYVGAGAAVKNGIQIGARSVIGLASAVYKDMGADTTAIGNPARLIPRSGRALF